MKKLFKRIAPLLLALVMVLGSCLTVSAASYSDDLGKNCYDKALARVKELGLDTSVYKYAVIGYQEPFGTSPYTLCYIFSAPVYVTSNGFNYDQSFSYVGCTYHGDSYSLSSGTGGLITGVGSIKRSSYDVYSSSTATSPSHTADTDFFPIPPTPVPPLVGAVQGAAPEEALKEVILLIPLSILFLVGCLGLRKGLRLLLTLLHQA